MVLQKAFQLVKTGAGALVGGGGGPLVLVKTDVHVNICNSGMISMVTLICFSMVMMNANLKSNLDMMFMMNMNVDLASPYPWLFLTVLVIAWLVYKISSDHGAQNGFKILAVLVIAGLIYKIYCNQQAQNGFHNLNQGHMITLLNPRRMPHQTRSFFWLFLAVLVIIGLIYNIQTPPSRRGKTGESSRWWYRHLSRQSSRVIFTRPIVGQIRQSCIETSNLM